MAKTTGSAQALPPTLPTAMTRMTAAAAAFDAVAGTVPPVADTHSVSRKKAKVVATGPAPPRRQGQEPAVRAAVRDAKRPAEATSPPEPAMKAPAQRAAADAAHLRRPRPRGQSRDLRSSVHPRRTHACGEHGHRTRPPPHTPSSRRAGPAPSMAKGPGCYSSASGARLRPSAKAVDDAPPGPTPRTVGARLPYAAEVIGGVRVELSEELN